METSLQEPLSVPCLPRPHCWHRPTRLLLQVPWPGSAPLCLPVAAFRSSPQKSKPLLCGRDEIPLSGESGSPAKAGNVHCSSARKRQRVLLHVPSGPQEHLFRLNVCMFTLKPLLYLVQPGEWIASINSIDAYYAPVQRSIVYSMCTTGSWSMGGFRCTPKGVQGRPGGVTECFGAAHQKQKLITDYWQ